jgi:hypothetical protein
LAVAPRSTRIQDGSVPVSLAHRVAALPSTAFGGAQQPPDEDTTVGSFRDSRTGASAVTARSAVVVVAAR